jgi:hypothetical protein
MKIDSSTFLPKARRKGIISKEVDSEVLVYDCDRDKAHCLNGLAAAIWKRCDGRTTVGEIGASLERELNASIDQQVVWLGLELLFRSRLLEKPAAWLPKNFRTSQMSRREAIKHVGLGVAIALPTIVTITAPTPVQAAVSCGARCKACSTGAECCSGVCAAPPVGTCPGGSPRCT